MDLVTHWPTILVLFLGIFLIAVGFSLRRHSYGVLLLWLGQASLVGLIVFHILRVVAD